MLYEEIGQFHLASTPWTCNQDEWSPGIIDLRATLPTLQNTDELVLWIQVYSVTSDGDSYQFKLGCSDTNDLTNLSGTIVYPWTGPAWLGSGAFLQKTSRERGLFSIVIPQICDLRYWQLYCEFTTGGGAADLQIFTGLNLRSAVAHRVGNIPCVSALAFP